VRAFDALLDGRIEVVGCPALLGEVASVLGRGHHATSARRAIGRCRVDSTRARSEVRVERLIADRAAGDLAQLRAEVERGLRTRRLLG
jgi:hypothetical protein